jgi:hypothetical protein
MMREEAVYKKGGQDKIASPIYRADAGNQG